MAQVITTLCDECLSRGEEVPGAPHGVTVEVPGAKGAAYVLDACEVHAKPVREMLAMLAEHGRRADRKTPLPRTVGAAVPGKPDQATPGPTSGAHVCPVEGCGHTTPALGGIRSHVQQKHGMTLSEARGENGSPCPAGCGRMLGAAQGVMAHLRSPAHGMSRDQARESIASARE